MCKIYRIFFIFFTVLMVPPSIAKDKISVDFNVAKDAVFNKSYKIEASRVAVEGKELQNKAVKWINGPSVFLSGRYIKYSLKPDISLNNISHNVNNSLSNVENTVSKIHDNFQPFSSLLGVPSFNFPRVPNRFNKKLRGETHQADVIVAWPIYTGGLSSAVKKYTKNQAEEAKADYRTVEGNVYMNLVSRYFGAKLSEAAMDLREKALKAVQNHDHQAQRMLDVGLISKVERLQASVSLEDAKREYEKSINQYELTASALKRLLKMDDAEITPTTPLFVNRTPLKEFDFFVERAEQNYPGLQKIAAIKEQAEAFREASASRWKPKVILFASHGIKRRNPTKIIGVNVNWTLWSPIDRRLSGQSSEKSVIQAQLTDNQAREDIALLVEKNWREVENARQSYFALDSNLQLAKEFLRLREQGLKEGVSTYTELYDAQTNLTKIETQQLQAAYDYMLALAKLLNNCGMPELFGEYLSQADIKIN